MKNAFIKLFYSLIVKPWLTLCIGVRYKNCNTFKNIDQFIVVANHNSHFDAVSIMAALPVNKLMKTRVVVASDYFGKTSLAIKAMKLFFNAIFINRNRCESEPSAIDILNGHLKKGRSIILFPEGSRGKPGVMSDFKKGIAILSKKNPHIPVIPANLNGFGRVLPKDKTLIIPLVCKVRFGEPLFPKGNVIESILDEIKEAIVGLKSKDEPDRNRFALG